MKYYINKTLEAQSFSGVKDKVTEALKEQGFGVLTEIDIQATMKKKLDKDYLPTLILGACNPGFADKVLTIDPNMSAMLPCNVTIRELENGKVEVSAIDPEAAMVPVGKEEIKPLAKEVKEKLAKAIETIK
ncbi:MAG: DUF302 domain-containing protein [Cytophagales bacterium]|uniref:DUF302 domain-containing protein n=1 Tax=Cyclobacterium marinum TaxID=104 RepID=UPI0011EF52C9|nr:DUF302 domain-containing protein [Cyclobacterium marinum]MBI0398859.1 DUF302 domain-containing protein [Cyclobacterium marinum]MBR9774217.1 DUF302 domain-containing protein [Cytophagales bacterium]|tara:strand:+ start:51379 stop:51771 length:393 start_codon:yes stop_codon:yes gene_type:complete